MNAFITKTATMKKFTAIHEAARWYSRSGFNLLIDYYPDCECLPYGSGATEENLKSALESIKPSAIIVYAKGHSGRTTYPGSLDCAHPRLAKDMLRFYRDVTREKGVRMFVYLSGMINGLAGARHPDWTVQTGQGALTYEGMTNMDGTKAKTACMCPTSPYFEEYTAVLLREIIVNYDPDGVWFDGDWGGAYCYCNRCKRLFEKWLGKKLETLPLIDDAGSDLGRAWQNWLLLTANEWRRKCAELIHALKPDCLYSSGNVTLPAGLPDYMDYHSGDWFSPNNHRVRLSMAMRYLDAAGKPFEAMTCDTQFCKGVPRLFRARTKTLDRMLQEGATVLANGGQWVYWTYPRGDGALIPSKVRQAAQAREFYEQRRELWRDTVSASECVVITGRQHARVVWSWFSDALAAALNTAIKLHRSPDFLELPRLAARGQYKTLILNDEDGLTGAQIDFLAGLVADGATLLASGVTIKSPGMAELLGLKLVREAALDEGHIRRSDGEFTGIKASWHHVEPVSAAVKYSLYKSWGCDIAGVADIPVNYPMIGMVDESAPAPAGFPALTVREIGKGRAVYIACNPYAQWYDFGYPDIASWLREVFERFTPAPLIKTNAPGWCELTCRKKGNRLLIHLINGNSGFDLAKVNNCDLFGAEIPEVGPYKLALRRDFLPKQAAWRPEDLSAELHENAGYYAFTTPRFHIHTCLELTCDEQSSLGNPDRA